MCVWLKPFDKLKPPLVGAFCVPSSVFAMPWQKGVSKGKGKGKGKGSGKGKSKGEMQHPAKVQKKLDRLEGMVKELVKGQKQVQSWDCACGTSHNWHSRSSCRGCGAAKGETAKPKCPPTQETATCDKVENLDEQIREQEGLVKALSGECSKDSQKETMQQMAKEKLAELKAAAREKKPLPAQFQAAAKPLRR